jgi:hypothetical protein
LLTVATEYRHCIGSAMTLAVMGYHFQVMTSRLSRAVTLPLAPPEIAAGLTGESGGQVL